MCLALSLGRFQRNEAVSFCITVCVATNSREGVRSASGQTERGFTEGDRGPPQLCGCPSVWRLL